MSSSRLQPDQQQLTCLRHFQRLLDDLAVYSPSLAAYEHDNQLYQVPLHIHMHAISKSCRHFSHLHDPCRPCGIGRAQAEAGAATGRGAAASPALAGEESRWALGFSCPALASQQQLPCVAFGLASHHVARLGLACAGYLQKVWSTLTAGGAQDEMTPVHKSIALARAREQRLDNLLGPPPCPPQVPKVQGTNQDLHEKLMWLLQSDGPDVQTGTQLAPWRLGVRCT